MQLWQNCSNKICLHDYPFAELSLCHILLDNTSILQNPAQDSHLTFLPTRWLCSCIRAWASRGFLRGSKKCRANLWAYPKSALQPPHSQVSCGLGCPHNEDGIGGRLLPRLRDCSWLSFSFWFSVPCLAQPQLCSSPRLHAVATAWVTPAASKEKTKALSRKPRKQTQWRVESLLEVQAKKPLH